MTTSCIDHFSVLPTELLVHIFEYVSDDYRERCKVFSAVSRVNCTFQAVVAPLLYRKVICCCPKHLDLFGRTVFANERLARLVKIYQEYKGTSRFVPPMPPFRFDENLRENVSKEVGTLPSPRTPGDLSVAIAIALPNLQRLLL